MKNASIPEYAILNIGWVQWWLTASDRRSEEGGVAVGHRQVAAMATSGCITEGATIIEYRGQDVTKGDFRAANSCRDFRANMNKNKKGLTKINTFAVNYRGDFRAMKARSSDSDRRTKAKSFFTRSLKACGIRRDSRFKAAMRSFNEAVTPTEGGRRTLSSREALKPNWAVS
ncbi:hypothetical protein KFK09_002913 [Dendrobium nobile]|uniref:Uncharacterized protein n=1 Tax=Dendrobium nobile TaxID=94219 RepID=A0A8T3C2Z6_DENNO|nr:hypothetical protein KFK09_002913 [Dendrobium nobile]